MPPPTPGARPVLAQLCALCEAQDAGGRQTHTGQPDPDANPSFTLGLHFSEPEEALPEDNLLLQEAVPAACPLLGLRLRLGQVLPGHLRGKGHEIQPPKLPGPGSGLSGP